MVRQTAHDVFTDVPTTRQLEDLGCYGLFTPEHLGGSGWRPVEACAIAEEAGAAYNPISWAEIALAASALSRTSESLDAVLAGETSATFCTGRISLGAGSALRASGVFPFSAGLPAQIIVLTDEHGSIGAAVRSGEGITLDEQSGCLDTTRSFHCLRLHDADAVPIEGSELSWLTTAAQMLSCADTVGALRRAIAVVTDHLLERQAFGASLGSFQVVQHRLVDLEVLHASARALVQRAAEAIEGKGDHRAPTDAVSEKELRGWYKALYAEGVLGGGWPPERGGTAGHSPHFDDIATEELIRARCPGRSTRCSWPAMCSSGSALPPKRTTTFPASGRSSMSGASCSANPEREAISPVCAAPLSPQRTTWVSPLPAPGPTGIRASRHSSFP